jgi:hypothetical protein
MRNELRIQLSPTEFKAFSSYLQALTGRSSVTASSIKPDTTFVDINLRRIVVDRIHVDDAAFDRVSGLLNEPIVLF